MPVYVVPEQDALALNAQLPPERPFAQLEEGNWLHYSELVDLWGTAEPTVDQAVVAAGLGNSYAEYLATLPTLADLRCKIYRYFAGRGEYDENEPPFDVDYRVDLDRRLHPKTIFDKGALVRQEFYAESTLNPDGSQTFNDLIVAEDYVYVYDELNFARSRTLTITWYREDGSPHPKQKIMVKNYDQLSSIREGQRRRSNIIDTLLATVSAYLVGQGHPLDTGRALVTKYQTYVSAFIYSGTSELVNAIQADTEFTWLDDEIQPGVTIRAYIVQELQLT